MNELARVAVAAHQVNIGRRQRWSGQSKHTERGESEYMWGNSTFLLHRQEMHDVIVKVEKDSIHCNSVKGERENATIVLCRMSGC